MLLYNSALSRDVAQLGSALQWGCRGRRFESSHPDQYLILFQFGGYLFLSTRVNSTIPTSPELTSLTAISFSFL